MDQPKTWPFAICPLKIIDQAPVYVALYLHAFFDRVMNRIERMRNPPFAVAVIEVSDTVFSDNNRLLIFVIHPLEHV